MLTLNMFSLYVFYLDIILHDNLDGTTWHMFYLGQVDSTEFAESMESSENHNFLSSLIKQPKNYP